MCRKMPGLQLAHILAASLFALQPFFYLGNFLFQVLNRALSLLLVLFQTTHFTFQVLLDSLQLSLFDLDHGLAVQVGIAQHPKGDQD